MLQLVWLGFTVWVYRLVGNLAGVCGLFGISVLGFGLVCYFWVLWFGLGLLFVNRVCVTFELLWHVVCFLPLVFVVWGVNSILEI